MYKLAEKTASYKVRGLSSDESMQEILDALRKFVISFSKLGKIAKRNSQVARTFKLVKEARQGIRKHPHNQLI